MNSDDPIKLRNYQDDFDTEFDDIDPIIDEETDDPTEDLGVPPAEFRDELDKYDVDDMEHSNDDMRETIEDYDEDSNDAR